MLTWLLWSCFKVKKLTLKSLSKYGKETAYNVNIMSLPVSYAIYIASDQDQSKARQSRDTVSTSQTDLNESHIHKNFHLQTKSES